MSLKRALGFVTVLLLMWIVGDAQTPVPPAADSPQAFLNQYCTGCHNSTLKTAQLDLKSLDPANVGQHAETWEKVVRKLRTGMMPPANAPRPSRAVIDAFATGLETRLDRVAAAALARRKQGRPRRAFRRKQ